MDETPRRRPTLFLLLSAVSVAYHLWALLYGFVTPHVHAAIHLGLALSVVLVVYDFRGAGRKSFRLSATQLADLLMACALAACMAYVALDYGRIIYRTAEPTTLDKLACILIVAIVLEAARRTTGLALPVIALVFLAYAFAGPYLPGVLQHRGVSLARLTSIQILGQDGVFGVAVRASGTVVFMFIVFGAVLQATGAGDMLTNLAFAIAGHLKGGPSKVALIASALFGTISGSAVANVVTTGQFTIPMMKKVGFDPAYAGAVEAVASTGGIIMPPILGAAAFIMADILGVSYYKIVVAAIVPALLYYLALYVNIHYEAEKNHLRGLARHELPSVSKTLSHGGLLLLPIFFFIYLISTFYPVLRAAFYSVLLLLLVSMMKPATRINRKKAIAALEGTLDGLMPVAAACAAAGVVIGVINATGLGIKFGTLVMALSGGNQTVALFLTMLITLVLGMGLPATAAYVIGASVTVAPLAQLGVSPLVAHLFVFYFSALSSITPPVALAAYAGAGLAGSNPMRTGFIACRIGLVAFIVPYMFVSSPALILQGGALEVIQPVLTATVGTFFFGVGLVGYFRTSIPMWARLPLIAAGFMLIDPAPLTDLFGVLLGCTVLVLNWLKAKKQTCACLARDA